MASQNPLSVILDQNKLTGPNYSDWLRNLKIVPASERIAYTLDKTPPKEAPVNATPDELEKLEKWSDRNLQARCYMLASMSNEMQRWFEETVDAKDIHIHLQELYGAQTRSVRHATIKELMTTHMRDGASVHKHGVKMIGLIEKLVSLDLVIPHKLSTYIILLSLPSSFDNFVVNFNMNKLEATLEELINMLANYEATMKKEKICFPCGFIFWIQERTQEKGKEAFYPYEED
ncbi:uncharacterized protein LOC121979488 [Zingiber officinale]|uniref:Uncharacterized protein n=1 Tax=Zingiber officinale TaxID=94328 RepID=A0A8J5GMN4_ZINOF|nr:uncharacterized protein LOC121979488 [Zingiber officinale]KAG6506400.1 hypothetical protein ZIOFF_031723 [Zingiber officinale]